MWYVCIFCCYCTLIKFRGLHLADVFLPDCFLHTNDNVNILCSHRQRLTIHTEKNQQFSNVKMWWVKTVNVVGDELSVSWDTKIDAHSS